MNFYRSIAICFAVVFSSGAFADQKPISACESISGSDQRFCMQRSLDQSEQALQAAEYSALATLQHWDEAGSVSIETQNRLKATARTFRIYRSAECGLVGNLGNVTKGRQLELNEMACIYELNLARMNHLSQIIGDLPRR